MEYIVFIHNNTDNDTKDEQWHSFFTLATDSGIFQSGSEIYHPEAIGKKSIPNITKNIDGFMRFETDDKEKLLLLLKKHPVIIEGGSLEVCEMPKR
jgi:hypothetical protein